MVWGSTVSAVHALVNERVLVVADTIGAVVEAEVAVVWVDEASSVQGCNSLLRVVVGLELCTSNVSLNLSIKYLVKFTTDFKIIFLPKIIYHPNFFKIKCPWPILTL